MKYVLIGLLKAWRLTISPLYGNVCRYYPSCSAYALRAVEFHGAVKGGWLTVRRLLRCHPWSPGGYDPVPGTPEWHAEMAEQGLRSQPVDDPLRQAQDGASTSSGRVDRSRRMDRTLTTTPTGRHDKV